MQIVANDVNEAFPVAMLNLNEQGVLRDSRNGKVLEYPQPVITLYRNPRQRVLFCKERDANPFFHFMEGLWILGGRDDVEFISRYNSNISQYSDYGNIFHGAYGKRMRGPHPGSVFDQLYRVIRILRKDPTSRRAVVQIWNFATDLEVNSKDIPCNDMIFFKVRDRGLDMTVCCRSNDAIWGCYGANVVHFSMLQEYMADQIGVNVGIYTQVSDSLHIYTEEPKAKWGVLKDIYQHTTDYNPYESLKIYPERLVDVPENWDYENRKFLNNEFCGYTNRIFTGTAIPMKEVWNMYKEGDLTRAVTHCSSIIAKDWRIACRNWLERRVKK